MRRLRLLCSVLVFHALVPAQVPVPRKPKLVVAIVIDQFRYDYLTRFRKDYNAGLAKMLEGGAVFTNAHYKQMPTVTAVGHSIIMSGAMPSVSGIAWPVRGKFDAIFCRNVLIYFDRPTQHRLLSRLAGLLKPEGFPFVGHSSPATKSSSPTWKT